MEEVLKQIIENIFPSEDMKNYLLEKVGELRKCQIINMIAGAMIPLERKKRFFERLAEIEKSSGQSLDSEKVEEFYWNAPYRRWVEEIDKVLFDLHIRGKEEGILLMQERELIDDKHEILGDLPFFSYEKFDAYLENYLKDHEEFRSENSHGWHMVEKYAEDEKGDLTEVCAYIFVNGELMFYTYGKNFDCWPNPDLNLPVPFKAGDIIEVDAKPFSNKKKGVIVEIGDNSDCCSVQLLHLNKENKVVHSPLKHSDFIYNNKGCVNLSALYTASVFRGELDADEEYLSLASEFIDGDEEQGRVLWSIDMVPLEKFKKEYMESQRQYICGKRDI